MSGAPTQLAIHVSGSNCRSGAMEYNYGRSSSLSLDGVLSAVPSSADRIFTALQGLWLASDNRCKPRNGIDGHVPDCRHRDNRQRHSLSEIARKTFGDDDYDHRREVRRAIANDDGEPGLLARPVMSWAQDGDVTASHSLAVLQEAKLLRHAKSEAGIVEFRFASSIFEQLMQGNYQRLHDAALHALSKSAWLLYRELFLQPKVGTLAPGQKAEFAITGRDPAIPVVRLGKARLRPDRLLPSLAKDAAAITKLGIGYDVSMQRRVGDGLKAIVRKADVRATSSHAGGPVQDKWGATSSPKGGYFEPKGGLLRAANRAQIVRADGLETSLETDRIPVRSVSHEDDPALAFLEEHFRRPLRPNTDKLVRRLTRDKALSPEQAVDVMRAGVKDGKDPIEAIREYRRPSRPIRTIDDIEEPPPPDQVAA